MLTKTHYQTDQEELYKACGGVMSQLLELDTGVKSAASELIGRDVIERFRPDKDHFLQHIVAMGDTETYGYNKNTDGWSKQALEERHQTFVTDAHFFREHRNRDPKTQGIGTVKFAAFDGGPDGMHRVELLVWGNKDKAEEEYELAKQGKELSYSMSARVPFDKCSCCGNEAKSRAQYCIHMRETPGQYLPEFKKYAYVDNPNPTFFDISRVKRPADRIARYQEYRFPDEDLRKAASDQQVILGVDWAEFNGLTVPEHLVPETYTGAKLEFLRKLAALEEEIQGVLTKTASVASAREAFIKNASKGTLGDAWTDTELETIRRLRPGTLFRELAKKACVLPFSTFYRYVSNTTRESLKDDPVFQKASCELPGMMGKLLEGGIDQGIPGMFCADSEYQSCTDPENTDAVQKLMDKADAEFGVSPEQTKPRVLHITIMNVQGDRGDAGASCDEEQGKMASVMARTYAAYQVEALSDIEKLSSGDFGDSRILTTLMNNFHN